MPAVLAGILFKLLSLLVTITPTCSQVPLVHMQGLIDPGNRFGCNASSGLKFQFSLKFVLPKGREHSSWIGLPAKEPRHLLAEESGSW